MFLDRVDFSKTIRQDAKTLMESVERLENLDDVSEILALAVKRS
jgi:hypothetical protein